MGNVETVQGIYESFGRGDIPAILDQLADDVQWNTTLSPDHGVEWLLPRRGPAEVARFFEALGSIDVTTLEPQAFLVDDDHVAAVIAVEWTAVETGGKFGDRQEIHLWTFGPDGKVVGFRHASDTLQQSQAMKG